MPLSRFAREGQCLEVRVPWLEVTLWFVPEERDAAGIERTGASRGRVWTASELMALMALPDRTPAIVETITHSKLALDGDIVEVRARPLLWDGSHLYLGESQVRTARWREAGLAFVTRPQPGDLVSLHWDFVCDILSPEAARRLRRATHVALHAVNRSGAAAPVLG
jgi:hypothetical protein